MSIPIVKIQALIEKYDKDKYANNHQKLLDRKDMCVCRIDIPAPSGNYHGAEMFEMILLPLKVVKAFQKFIKANSKRTVSYYEGENYITDLELIIIQVSNNKLAVTHIK